MQWNTYKPNNFFFLIRIVHNTLCTVCSMYENTSQNKKRACHDRSGCNGIGLGICAHILYLAQKPDIYRCVCSNRDRLGVLCRDVDYFWDSVYEGTYHDWVSNTVNFILKFLFVYQKSCKTIPFEVRSSIKLWHLLHNVKHLTPFTQC